MLKNYFKIALRNLQRHKAYSLLNISGLAIGMACSILILLRVRNELSYGRFHANASAEKDLSLNLFSGNLLPTLIGIGLTTGILSGIKPALFLSGFKPISVLKGKLEIGGGNLLFRNGFVITQFVVSIILLVGTAVVYKQLNFIKNKNLGFDKSNLLYMDMTGDMWNKQQALKTALADNDATRDYSVISDLPTALVTGTIDVQWDGKDPRSQVVVPSMDDS